MLVMAVDVARALAIVGEVCEVLETVYGRHRAVTHSIAGAQGAAYERDGGTYLNSAVGQGVLTGRGTPTRMLVCKPERPGHDRGAKVIAAAFADIGFIACIGPCSWRLMS